jgi:CIC family chloride channel protein
VVDKDGHLKGILPLTDVRRLLLEKDLYCLVVAKDIATEEVITITPDESLNIALKK